MALDIARLSGELAVRRLGAEDVPQILTLCSGNPQFYRYHPPMASEDGIRANTTSGILTAADWRRCWI